MLAPICLFTYNRLSETRLTIEALKNNYLASESNLFIFSDGPRNENVLQKVEEVRQYLKTVEGFKSVNIYESVENKGLANSIIAGVNQVIEKYGKVIVLEDDLITSPNFLDFINKALEFYKHETKIKSINGFSLLLKNVDSQSDVYFQTRPFSWGWATWFDRWDQNIFDKQLLKIEINSNNGILKSFKKACGDDIVKMFLNSISNKNDSWYVRWTYSHYKNKKYSVFPISSFVNNIGFGESGTHCKGVNPYKYKNINKDKTTFNFIEFSKPNKRITKEFLNYFSFSHKLFVRIRLLRSKSQRKQLISEIKIKLQAVL